MARPARRRGNLPTEATSFVGRRRELADLKRKLSSARLVSLVGPGGVGKTRLAIRAAAEVSRGFSGGAWLVELADVSDPALVGNAVMAAMDLRDQAAAAPSDPCSLTPSGGYSRLENLLYRLEVHDGVAKAAPTIDGPRFGLHGLKIKFQRRNASTLVRISNVSGAEFTVAPPALDPRNWFAPGFYAEIVSIHDDVAPRAALAPERLFRVALATDDRVVLEATAAQINATGVVSDNTWFLRLWDSFPDGSGLAIVSAPGNAAESAEIDLGDGLKIKLGGGAGAIFRRGDYWTGAARADDERGDAVAVGAHDAVVDRDRAGAGLTAGEIPGGEGLPVQRKQSASIGLNGY